MVFPLVAIPKTQAAVALLASEVRSCGATSVRADIDAICKTRSINIRVGEIEGSDIKALLLPRSHGGFFVIIRESMILGHDPKIGNFRVRFLVAHEIAHSLFYAPGAPPKRVFRYTPEEEQFCDDFARVLLVPPEKAAQVVEVSRVFALSEEVEASPRVVAHAACAHSRAKAAMYLRRTGSGWNSLWTVGDRFEMPRELVAHAWGSPGRPFRQIDDRRHMTAMRQSSGVLVFSYNTANDTVS